MKPRLFGIKSSGHRIWSFPSKILQILQIDCTHHKRKSEIICLGEFQFEEKIMFFFIPGVTEEVIMESEGMPQDDVGHVERIVYLEDGNVMVMEDSEQPNQEQFISEEIITEQWGESCPEEIGKHHHFDKIFVFYLVRLYKKNLVALCGCHIGNTTLTNYIA